MYAFFMGLKSISPTEALKLITEKKAIPFDLNSAQSWSRARVPGALNLQHLLFGEIDLPSDKSTTLIFYCSNVMCRKAPTAAKRAKNMGYTDVRVMSSGITGWQDEKLPVESSLA